VVPLSVTIKSYTFDKWSSEVAYNCYVLDLLKNELGRAKGTVTSGNIVGVSPAGVANTSLGSWTFVPSGSNR
jgi:hypothetical protein